MGELYEDRLHSLPADRDKKRFSKVVRRDGMRCKKCHKFTHFLTLDHIKRMADGGSVNSVKNLQLLCVKCHREKDEFKGTGKHVTIPPTWNEQCWYRGCHIAPLKFAEKL